MLPTPLNIPRHATRCFVRNEAFQLVRAAAACGKRSAWFPRWARCTPGILVWSSSSRDCDFTVVSIFVNPKQFSPHDFSIYPRPLETMWQFAGRCRFDFRPAVEEMYPPGFTTYVEVDGLTDRLEGASRPGHFRGVATVVLKLFQTIPADRAYFGRKDYQQSLIVRRMAADLNLPTEIVVCPLDPRCRRSGPQFAKCVFHCRPAPQCPGAVSQFEIGPRACFPPASATR